MEEKKKKLSAEACELIEETAKASVSKEIEYISENFMKIVSEKFLKLKDLQKSECIEEQNNMTEHILKKYFPLKKEISSIEKSLLTTEFLKDSEDEVYKDLMNSPFKPEHTTISENVINHYISLKQIYAFLDVTIEDYINELKEAISNDEKYYIKKKNERAKDSINKNKRKIYIMENYFKKNISARKIKLDIYENERTFAKDKEEILIEIAPRLTFISSVLNVF